MEPILERVKLKSLHKKAGEGRLVEFIERAGSVQGVFHSPDSSFAVLAL